MTWVYVCLAGALGTGLRYGCVTFLFPAWGVATTVGVNSLGCLLMGVLAALAKTWPCSESVKAVLLVGFCGAFTTFSTFLYDVVTLYNKQQYGAGLLYLLGSHVLGLACLGVGYWIGVYVYK